MSKFNKLSSSSLIFIQYKTNMKIIHPTKIPHTTTTNPNFPYTTRNISQIQFIITTQSNKHKYP